MKPFLVLLLIYLLINLFLVGVGVGVGFFLHWVLPVVDVGMGILIGIMVTAFSLHGLGRLMEFLGIYKDMSMEDVEPEPPPSILTPPIELVTPRRRKKRK
jgi:hypothetical protein